MNTIEAVAERALHEAIYRMAQAVIEEHVGCGVETEIKKAIKTKVEDLFSKDEELCGLLKERIKYWISEQ